MSTFNGRLVDPGLEFLAIDHFGKQVYGCDIFLLSHHHCDHMNGIYDQELSNLINESSSKLVYCSPLTAHFLRKNRSCTIRDDKIIALEINKPFVFQHDLVSTVIVLTCLPAAHCPGSVMFLLEFEDKRVLYSGDIRLTLEDLKHIVGTITNLDGSAVKIDDLYLDTTFAVPTKYESFPSRENSARLIIEFIKNFLSTSPSGKVALDIKAKFGYESLFLSLFKAFRKRIMVHDNVLACYEQIEEMRDFVTGFYRCQDDDWLIHACREPEQCNLVPNAYIVKPCALGFVKYSNRDTIIEHKKYQVPYEKISSTKIKVFYSTHCSLKELRDIVEYLEPKRVFPSVIVDQSFRETLELIRAPGEEKSTNNGKSIGLRVLPSHRKRSREEFERIREEKRKLLCFRS